MPPIKLSFSEAPLRQPLPVGEEYTLRIKSATVENAKDGQSQNLVVEFLVEDAPVDDYTVKRWFNLGKKSLWNLRIFLNIVAGDERYTDEDVEFDPDELVGERVGATMTTSVFEGRENSTPDKFFAI